MIVLSDMENLGYSPYICASNMPTARFVKQPIYDASNGDQTIGIRHVNTTTLKAVSHDATSLMRFGFMKLVSPCDRAKTCRKRLLKVPCDCFYDRALLYSCNLFHATLPYRPIRFSIISVQSGGGATFIYRKHMVTILPYTY